MGSIGHARRPPLIRAEATKDRGRAGEFLLPRAAVYIPAAGRGADIDAALSITAEIARAWNVSQGVVTTRLLQDGWITDEVAGALFQAFAARWRTERQRICESRDPEEGAPGYYVVRRSRQGSGLLDAVRRGLRNDVLTPTKAAQILGVSASAIDPLLARDRRAA